MPRATGHAVDQTTPDPVKARPFKFSRKLRWPSFHLVHREPGETIGRSAAGDLKTRQSRRGSIQVNRGRRVTTCKSLSSEMGCDKLDVQGACVTLERFQPDLDLLRVRSGVTYRGTPHPRRQYWGLRKDHAYEISWVYGSPADRDRPVPMCITITLQDGALNRLV